MFWCTVTQNTHLKLSKLTTSVRNDKMIPITTNQLPFIDKYIPSWDRSVFIIWIQPSPRPISYPAKNRVLSRGALSDTSPALLPVLLHTATLTISVLIVGRLCPGTSWFGLTELVRSTQFIRGGPLLGAISFGSVVENKQFTLFDFLLGAKK